MKVKELIQKLQEENPDAEVYGRYTTSCSCAAEDYCYCVDEPHEEHIGAVFSEDFTYQRHKKIKNEPKVILDLY